MRDYNHFLLNSEEIEKRLRYEKSPRIIPLTPLDLFFGPYQWLGSRRVEFEQTGTLFNLRHGEDICTYSRPKKCELFQLPSLRGAPSRRYIHLDPYLVFSVEEKNVRLSGGDFKNVARLAKDPTALNRTVERYGPLCFTQVFDFSLVELPVLTEYLQRNGLASEAEALTEQPYTHLWRKGRIQQLVTEDPDVWFAAAKYFHHASEILRAVKEEDLELLEREISQTWDDSLDNRDPWWKRPWLGGKPIPNSPKTFWMSNIDRRMPTKVGDGAFRLAKQYLLSRINQKLFAGSGDLNLEFQVDGLTIRSRSLAGILCLQVLREVMGHPEYHICASCGWWFEVSGKARGRGKKTCSSACRKALSESGQR